MRVLVADRLPEVHRARLTDAGHDVTYQPDLQAADLATAVRGHDVLVVRSTRVSPEAVAADEALRLVIRAGSGTDTIDSEAAARSGVAVCNVPGRNAVAVAELAVGLVLAIDRRIPDQVADLRAGRWRKGAYQAATGIAGRSVGVVGLGDIGLAFAQRMAALDTHLWAVSDPDRDPARQRRAEQLGLGFVGDLEALAAGCDVLSFHVPLSPRTRGLIGEPLLSQVKPGTILINTSRGELIDAPAVLAALDARELILGTDVYPDEPAAAEGVIDAELARHPRVYGTHHVGASTAQAQASVADGVLDAVAAFADGQLLHCVNAERLAGATT